VTNGDKLLTPFSSPLSSGFAANCHNWYYIFMTEKIVRPIKTLYTGSNFGLFLKWLTGLTSKRLEQYSAESHFLEPDLWLGMTSDKMLGMTHVAGSVRAR
jgi:hypothetical protein